MQGLIKKVLRILELTTFLVVGFLVTIYVLSDIYESVGIEFIGNVWVNWFGVSYFIFVIYTIINGLLLKKYTDYFIQRLKTRFFWLLFIGSMYIIIVPFVKGENPF